MFVDAFAELPYKVLWKYDSNELPGKPPNVKIFQWMPQQDILSMFSRCPRWRRPRELCQALSIPFAYALVDPNIFDTYGLSMYLKRYPIFQMSATNFVNRKNAKLKVNVLR